MKYYLFFTICFAISIQSVSQEIYGSKDVKKQKIDVVYDYSCLEFDDDYGTNKTITTLGDLTRDIQDGIMDINGGKFSVNDQMELGDYLLENFKKEFTINNNGYQHKKLTRILKDLVSRLANPKGIKYKIHYVEDSEMGLFTIVGGHIFMPSGFYEFLESDSEIAVVLSHEIAHNELGHTSKYFEKLFIAKNMGIPFEIAEFLISVEEGLLTSFDQKQEAAADLFGIDIVYPTGYSKCSSIKLWERMSKEEGDSNAIENLLRSHPYGKVRATCLENHLENNYNYNCNF